MEHHRLVGEYDKRVDQVMILKILNLKENMIDFSASIQGLLHNMIELLVNL